MRKARVAAAEPCAVAPISCRPHAASIQQLWGHRAGPAMLAHSLFFHMGAGTVGGTRYLIESTNNFNKLEPKRWQRTHFRESCNYTELLFRFIQAAKKKKERCSCKKINRGLVLGLLCVRCSVYITASKLDINLKDWEKTTRNKMVPLWKNYVILIEFNSPRIYLPDEDATLPWNTGMMKICKTRDQALKGHK